MKEKDSFDKSVNKFGENASKLIKSDLISQQGEYKQFQIKNLYKKKFNYNNINTLKVNDPYAYRGICDEDSELNEYDYFRLLFSDEIVDLLVEESNNYYKAQLIEKYGREFREKILSTGSTSSYQYLYVTKGIGKEDILAFIGIRIYMGLHKYPRNENYWDNSNLYKTGINTMMPKNYFFLIAKALHFPEKEEEDNNSSESEKTENVSNKDPRYKINLYLEKLAKNFRKYYTLGENITIDESLVQFKGRNSMKFYIPMKPHKYGFKIHLLCDADTHYLYNLLFDPGRVGKDFIYQEDTSSLAESVVLKLLSVITDNDKKKRNLFCDGWYSSISLMKKLTKMGYLNTTVLRANSKDLPPKIKMEGYDRAYSDSILIQKYEGKKTIYFATNYKIDKEELRNIYNIKNRGVDIFDQYLEISSIQRKTKKWYKKIFIFGIEACIINSKILYEINTGKTCTTVNYKAKLTEQIFRMYYNHRNKFTKQNIFNSNNNSNSIKNSYYFHNITQTTKEEKNCKNCHKKTKYICIECNMFMHPECFTKYHNRYIYK